MSQRAPAQPRSAPRALDRVRAVVLSPLGIGFVTACCLVAADLRRLYQVDPGYGFLRWNLALAWIPLLLAYALSFAARRRVTRPALPLLALAWIVFLPNAPYLVTDMVHLREQVSVPNAITLSLLAVTGMLIGVRAVQLVQAVVEQLFGTRAGWRAVRVIVVLTAFGVYLGRVLRWNSWTVILHPHELAHAVLRSPSEPGRVGLALLGTLAFAALFSIAYHALAGAAAKPARLSPDGSLPATRS